MLFGDLFLKISLSQVSSSQALKSFKILLKLLLVHYMLGRC